MTKQQTHHRPEKKRHPLPRPRFSGGERVSDWPPARAWSARSQPVSQDNYFAPLSKPDGADAPTEGTDAE